MYENAFHSCNDKTVGDFLNGKSFQTIELFHFLVSECQKIGSDIVLHPAKSRIAFAARIRFAYIHRLGKNYVDTVLQFKEPFHNTQCFYKVANIPGSNKWNHYFRIYSKQDFTEEVKHFMQLCYESGQ